MTTDDSLKKRLSLPYEEALERVKEELKQEGFGVLTEIDMKSTLREKLDVDFRKYTIIGAWNPPWPTRPWNPTWRSDFSYPAT